jgi:hypothetical protein
MKLLQKIILLSMLFIGAQYTAASEPPSGNLSPEGIASDMASAFINADSKLWNKIVLKLNNPEYKKFIQDITKQMDLEAKIEKSKRVGPKEIGVVFKLGALSKNGPNSYAYAAKNIEQIGFVDVGILNHDGSKTYNRTFVAKKNKKWFVLPRPDLFPLLTAGLNEEKNTKIVIYQK